MIQIDTLAYRDRLKQEGIPDDQAEGHAKVLAEVLRTHTDELATKTDIQLLKSEIANLEVSLNGRIDNLEARLNGRMDKLEGSIDRLSGRLDKQTWMIGVAITLCLLNLGILLRVLMLTGSTTL